VTCTVKEERELSLFVRREIDDYGLDPYEFRLYARITRRAGNGEAWESMANMASACCMSLSRARRALQLLKLARLIESIERPGYSNLHRLTPQHRWVAPECLQELRQFISLPKSPTPIRCDRGTRNGSPTKNNQGVLSDVIPLPLSDVIDEGIPSEGISLKVLPQSPLTPQGEGMGERKKTRKENFDAMGSSSLLQLSQQLAQSLTEALKPVFANLVAETKSALSQVKERSLEVDRGETKFQPKQRNKSSIPDSNDGGLLDEMPDNTLVLEGLARLVCEPVESLRLNPNLTAALSQHPDNVEPAMLYFKQAVATWKKKPGLGLFISAVKKGLKPVPTKPGGGWGDWANEAMKRQLMQFSCSHEGDIMVYFVGGIQKLWSEVRHLNWAEIEAMVADASNEPCSA